MCHDRDGKLFSSLTPLQLRPLPPSLGPFINAPLADICTIAHTAVAARSASPTNGSGQLLFMGDTTAGDTASAGVLIANKTNFLCVKQDYYDYASAATAQVQYYSICLDRRYQGRVMVRSPIGSHSSNFGTYPKQLPL